MADEPKTCATITIRMPNGATWTADCLHLDTNPDAERDRIAKLIGRTSPHVIVVECEHGTGVFLIDEDTIRVRDIFGTREKETKHA